MSTGHWVTAYLGLGANVGARRRQLRAALEALHQPARMVVRRQAPWYETEPVGVEDQPWFLNTVAEVRTVLGPHALLAHCKAVERALGRRLRARWGPREIDVDVLLYGAWVVRTPTLVIPHPQMRNRRFVLTPLADLVPEGRDPLSGQTFTRLARGVEDPKKVRLSRRF